MKSDSTGTPQNALPPVLPDWQAIHSVHYRFLANQQNMLEDRERTGAYQRGMLRNRKDFEGKVVVDVGAGTGILSVFAAQAGARKVYAIEGTESAEHVRRLAEGNGCSDRIEVVNARLEDVVLPEKADIIISEPWGFLLFHERMVEAFLIARDRFLAPGGTVFPSTGRVSVAPFIDQKLFEQRQQRKLFWYQKDFFGVDMTELGAAADEELTSMPALGYVPTHMLMAGPSVTAFDFRTMPLAALAEVVMPFEFVTAHPGPIHGLAGWFDVSFDGSTEHVLLTTAPDAPRTHWAPMRFVLPEAVEVKIGDRIRGALTLRANPQSSYTALLDWQLEGRGALPSQRFELHSYFWWDGG